MYVTHYANCWKIETRTSIYKLECLIHSSLAFIGLYANQLFLWMSDRVQVTHFDICDLRFGANIEHRMRMYTLIKYRKHKMRVMKQNFNPTSTTTCWFSSA